MRTRTTKNSGVGVLVAMMMLAGACASGSDSPSDDAVAAQFGPVVGPITEIIGENLAPNRVVSLPCIPSRRDPVGVWLGMRILQAEVVSNGRLSVAVESTDARLGSHPSGCRNPRMLPAQSVFVLAGAEPFFATGQSVEGDVTTLQFVVADRELAEMDLVILPTIEFEMKSGERQTTIFGLVGRYSVEVDG